MFILQMFQLVFPIFFHIFHFPAFYTNFKDVSIFFHHFPPFSMFKDVHFALTRHVTLMWLGPRTVGTSRQGDANLAEGLLGSPAQLTESCL